MIYEKMKNALRLICDDHDWLGAEVAVSARTLSGEEAIGRPTHRDYPILEGKESIMEAVFQGARGHVFTDMPGNFSGSITDILALPLKDNFERAVFVATINAVFRRAGRIEKTVHCKNDEPVECAGELAEFIGGNWDCRKVFLVGLQPRMAEELSRRYDLRITDMDRDNIGVKFGETLVESADKTEACLAWCDFVLATGTTFANDTARQIIESGKPFAFYGVSCAAATHILGLPRFCPRGS